MSSEDSLIEDFYYTEEKFICADCIDDLFMKKYIQDNGVEDECSYCNNIKQVINIEEISERLLSYVGYFYDKCIDCAPYESREGGYIGWDQETTPETIIEEIFSFDECKAYDDVMKAFNSDTISEPIIKIGMWTESLDSEKFIYSWKHFCDLTKKNEVFDNNFEDRDIMPTKDFFEKLMTRFNCINTNQESYNTIEMIKKLNIGEKIYRAREITLPQESFYFNKEKELGAPPSKCAQSNRMSAKGTSFFYATQNKATAIKEINPQEEVTVGEWELTKEAKMLDLFAFYRKDEHFHYDIDIPETYTIIKDRAKRDKIYYNRMLSPFDTDNLWNSFMKIFVSK